MSRVYEAVQQGIFEKLMGHEELRALVDNRIYDVPPLGKTYPCIVFGQESSKPFDTKTSKGHEMVQTLYVFDEKEGLSKVKKALGILEALFNESVAIEGFYLVRSQVMKIDVKIDKSGIARGEVQFKMVLQALV